jgi:hypothetical protein
MMMIIINLYFDGKGGFLKSKPASPVTPILRFQVPNHKLMTKSILGLSMFLRPLTL